jgi:hypothetical protein
MGYDNFITGLVVFAATDNTDEYMTGHVTRCSIFVSNSCWNSFCFVVAVFLLVQCFVCQKMGREIG